MDGSGVLTNLLGELQHDSLGSLVKLVLGVLLLLLQRGHHVCLRAPLPVIKTVDLRKRARKESL